MQGPEGNFGGNRCDLAAWGTSPPLAYGEADGQEGRQTRPEEESAACNGIEMCSADEPATTEKIV